MKANLYHDWPSVRESCSRSFYNFGWVKFLLHNPHNLLLFNSLRHFYSMIPAAFNSLDIRKKTSSHLVVLNCYL